MNIAGSGVICGKPGPKKTWKFISGVLSALFVCAFFIFFIFFISAESGAAVRYSKIEEVPGLRFENLAYSWDKVELDVINATSGNKTFGGVMIFLDRRGRPLARASLLPKKITAQNRERYAAYFLEGSGEAAQKAARIVWDLGAI